MAIAFNTPKMLSLKHKNNSNKMIQQKKMTRKILKKIIIAISLNVLYAKNEKIQVLIMYQNIT